MYVAEKQRRKLWKDPVNSKWPKHPEYSSLNGLAKYFLSPLFNLGFSGKS